MLLAADLASPSELTGYTRAGLDDLEANQPSLGRWLPNRPVDDLEFRFNRGGSGLTDAATYRTFDAESPIGARPGVTRVSGELPPISRKIRLGEYDRLRMRGLDQRILDEVFNDAGRMMRSIVARLELARGQALFTGAVSLNENGVLATVDFGRNAAHAVAPAVLWSTVATATPLLDLLTWRDTYLATNGRPPGAILTSTRVVGFLLRNAEMRQLAGTIGGAPAIVTQTAVSAVLQAYGLPPIHIYDAMVSVNGVATKPIPDDRVLLLPAPDPNPETNDLGSTPYGTTAEALEWTDLAGGDEAGIVAAVYKTYDPVALWTKASAIALPIVANPDYTFVADVA